MTTQATAAISIDAILLAVALALVSIGLIAIASASVEHANWTFQNPWHHTVRHCFYLAIAAVTALVAYRLPIAFWQRTSGMWLLLALGLLCLVLIPGIGRTVNGSQRWLPLGPLTLQPSELAKFAVVLYTSAFLVRHGDALKSGWQGLAKPIGVLSLFAILLLFEPDFGATVIVSGTMFVLLFLGGAKLLHIGALLALAAGGLAMLIVSAPYRLQRLTAYTDPWSDPYGSGFQLVQSLIAFGRGELFGVGLGNSIQKLFYLPEAHTDFVFSIWAEEMGLVGALAVVVLYVLLVARILRLGFLALQAQQPFSGFVCFGVAMIFSGQAFVNMGVSSGLLPTKGLTLPFISYGGSSLVVSCVMLALVMRVHNELAARPSRGRSRR